MTVHSKRHVLPCLILAMLSATPASASESVTNSHLLKEREMTQHPYVGMWSTDDGRVRHELLPDGRYDEARGSRQSAYQGRYEVTGTHIEYWDDTGFTADGDFVDENTLHHGGMILRRQ
ncbi:MAG: Atu4866 domain-containing protein [Aquamicrobium sp.]|jgi:5-hydroxyisourate hydrolase-like protein (transthyretin family)|uniref:Atu4866 domain-containing protein n=1 Tax=Mesorhizobium sp. Pch-S TaxID=2082387 RepID=UPI00101154CD|nr:Atu4866 domain-containing protein [Mesorhizobium sp. Pch-S]MBR2688710.1 Atu4866 domain-containing protein [Aquamicrobium sp.]QAZ45677.1 hypothetical protein C1M53_24915 [Mesorhizobium sp. Pch-S]